MSPHSSDAQRLLAGMIRNACVNDGSPGSGGEVRNADLLEDYLAGCGLEILRAEPAPGRGSLVARLPGTDPDASSLCLLGHIDVVPASAEGWRHDPFGGELVDGEIWGRGAIDMLDVVAGMAVAMRTLAVSGRRPAGDIVFAAVADEEAGGALGAQWLLDHDDEFGVDCDYVLTESGGLVLGTAEAPEVTISVAEKGLEWRRLRVRGVPGHGSTPYGARNAAVLAAEVVRRLVQHQPAARVDDLWQRYVTAAGFDPDLARRLTDPALLEDALAELPAGAAHAHACTHTTVSPNAIRADSNVNVIPDYAEVDVDIRTLPGDGAAEVEAYLAEALGELAAVVEVETLISSPSTRSPTENPFFTLLGSVVADYYPKARPLPVLAVGSTDARHFRRRGRIAYGFGLRSRELTQAEFRRRFHGRDERVDLVSLDLTTRALCDVVGRFATEPVVERG